MIFTFYIFVGVFVHNVQNEIADFPVFNEVLSTDGIEKKNIQTLTNKTVGYLPIAEILKRVNLTHINNGSRFDHKIQERLSTTQKMHIPLLKQNIVKLLLIGDDEEILQIPYNAIIDNLKMFDTTLLSPSKRAIIWDLLTSNIPVENMDPTFLNDINGLWCDMPENELIRFNVQQWDVLDFFGSSKFLKRRQAAIIAYMIKRTYDSVLQKSEYINKLKGLICGFPESDLANISSSVFKDIKQVVFQNIWPCTLEQVKTLLNNAKRPDTYGPLEVWTKEVFQKLGLVVTIISPHEFKKFNEDVFKGLNITILDLMSDEQLVQFTKEQVANLHEDVVMSYKLRINNFQLIQQSEDNGSSNMNRKLMVWFVISIMCFLVNE